MFFCCKRCKQFVKKSWTTETEASESTWALFTRFHVHLLILSFAIIFILIIIFIDD